MQVKKHTVVFRYALPRCRDEMGVLIQQSLFTQVYRGHKVCIQHIDCNRIEIIRNYMGNVVFKKVTDS